MDIIIGGKNIMNDEVQAVSETAGVVAEATAKSGLSTGAKTGIVCGVAAVAVAGVVGTVMFIRKRKAKKTNKTVEEAK